MQHLSPQAAWDFIQSHAGDALPPLFVDVRMEIESMYVGRPPGTVHVAWYEYPDFTPNAAAFAQTVKDEAGDLNRPVVLICRSGSRTLSAGEALERAGFTHVINVLEGFEGELDEHDHRSSVNGWRARGLPWEQL